METRDSLFDAAYVAGYTAGSGRRGLLQQGIELKTGDVEWLSGVNWDAGGDILTRVMLKDMIEGEEVMLLGVKVLRRGHMVGTKVVWDGGGLYSFDRGE